MSAPETIDEARWSLLAQLGVRHAHLRALAERLDADFTVESYGYEQFSSLGDIRLRAVVSDQLLRTAHAIVDNLLAAGLHRERLDELVGGGRTMSKGVEAAVVLRDGAGIDIALTGFFGALPSALDCLAGVAIAVARLPKSITKADINDLGPLTAKQLAKGTAAQQKTWNDLATLVAAQEAFPPPGWFDWLMAMRNLLTHRARQQRVLLQRTIEAGGPQLAVVTDTPADVAATWRFDLHLRRRPSLPDMQDFTLPGPPNNLWIGERATDTVAGVLLLASELIDGVSEHLLDVWQQTEASPSDYPPPAAWALEPEPVASFDGITGTTSPLRPSSGHTHEQFARRLALARAHPARDAVRRRHALEAAPIHGYGAHPLRPVDRQLAGL